MDWLPVPSRTRHFETLHLQEKHINVNHAHFKKYISMFFEFLTVFIPDTKSLEMICAWFSLLVDQLQEQTNQSVRQKSSPSFKETRTRILDRNKTCFRCNQTTLPRVFLAFVPCPASTTARINRLRKNDFSSQSVTQVNFPTFLKILLQQ